MELGLAAAGRRLGPVGGSGRADGAQRRRDGRLGLGALLGAGGMAILVVAGRMSLSGTTSPFWSSGQPNFSWRRAVIQARFLPQPWGHFSDGFSLGAGRSLHLAGRMAKRRRRMTSSRMAAAMAAAARSRSKASATTAVMGASWERSTMASRRVVVVVTLAAAMMGAVVAMGRRGSERTSERTNERTNERASERWMSERSRWGKGEANKRTNERAMMSERSRWGRGGPRRDYIDILGSRADTRRLLGRVGRTRGRGGVSYEERAAAICRLRGRCTSCFSRAGKLCRPSQQTRQGNQQPLGSPPVGELQGPVAGLSAHLPPF